MPDQLDSTYGASFIAWFLATLLHGIGVEVWPFFFRRPADKPHVKWTVLLVLALETLQALFFFRSSYSRFIERFGQIQIDLIWADSLQILVGYLTKFTVQVHFLTRLHAFANRPRKSTLFVIGVYIILTLALVQISAGIAQTVVSYRLRGYTRLSETTPITIVQSAASFACAQTDYHFVSSHIRWQFFAFPNTYRFFLGLAPSSKLYMITLLPSLNEFPLGITSVSEIGMTSPFGPWADTDKKTEGVGACTESDT
ncbi:hypothetical protein MVEN_00065100 [Mycena venus]|uniref:Uncharacterized protein n=1 Tax=Mycena venus TaxID=2733690 RepID=A0A8H6Z4A9_9AGAR|nr:hypothetical protein MVEN_00065100 [Mycena venus]